MKTILSEAPTGMGGKWQLVQYESDFYGYGTEAELNSFWGASVNNYGTKEEMINEFNRMSNLLDDFIQDSNKKGFYQLVNQYINEKNMIIGFLSVLQA